MEPRFVAASTVNLIAGIDSQVRFVPGDLQNFDSFDCTESTTFRSEGFDYGQGLALPHYFAFDLEILTDPQLFRFVLRWCEELGEVVSERVRPFFREH
jgi:hypothetical protein